MPRGTRRSMSGIAAVILTVSLGLAACENNPLEESGPGTSAPPGGDGSVSPSMPTPEDTGASSGQGDQGSGQADGPPPGSQNPGASKDGPQT
ncbi:MAG: hypothetical protein ACRDV9_05585, partial [Acidimicrobiia bacterium]